MENDSQVGVKYSYTALVCSILGLILFLAPYIGIIFSILAIVFYKKGDKKNTAGIFANIFGIIGVAVNTVITLIIILYIIIFGF